MENAPVILAMDTSLGPCSVAVWHSGAVRAQACEESHGKQSRLLVPMIESVLEQAGVNYVDCDAVACTIGPGGFTGIRTGLATARAIALVTGKPLIGLTTLEVIAYGAKAQGEVVAVIDAHRGQWYVQRFRCGDELTPLSEPLLVDDNGKQAIAQDAHIVQSVPYAADVAALAHDKWQRGERKFPVAPLYLREPDAKLPI